MITTLRTYTVREMVGGLWITKQQINCTILKMSGEFYFWNE